MVLLAASSVVCKELLFRWSKRVGERAGSRVVVANAYHHRADAWSGGVALIGVGGQMMGIPGVDGISGLVVSLSVCKMGYDLLRDSVLEFFDHQRGEDVARVRKQLMKFYVFLEAEGKLRLEISESDAEGERDLGQGSLPLPLVGCSTGSCALSVRATTDELPPQGGPETNKMRFVNVFLTRHGRFYVVHMKVLLRDDFTALQLQTALSKLNAYLSRSLSIQDVFASVQVCSEVAMPRKEYIELYKKDMNGGTQSEAKATEVHTAAEGDLVNPTLEDCMHMLIDFHAFQHGIQYNWEKREIYVTVKHKNDCFRDVESVAKMFGCKLIAKEPTTRKHGQCTL
ncbi:unnamed protein product [Phytomonas sp. EM1]|nr:unnamed protein product [Phytomonas sp. EM1]|eukprot:CCW64728.1 unnamed protein product [Phytomonas sp. isolate EM1]